MWRRYQIYQKEIVFFVVVFFKKEEEEEKKSHIRGGKKGAKYDSECQVFPLQRHIPSSIQVFYDTVAKLDVSRKTTTSSTKSGAPRGSTLLEHAVELRVSSASESRRREPRLGCPSRVIPPLALLSLLPGRMRRSGTLCTLNVLQDDNRLKVIKKNVNSGVS